MKRAFLFLGRVFLPLLWVYLGYGVLISACAGFGDIDGTFLGGYYRMFPMVPVLCLFLFGTSSGTYLALSLSLGCRRRDYLAAAQGVLAANALACTVLTALFLSLPGRLGWTWVEPFMSPDQLPLLLLLTVAAGELSTAVGLLLRTRRWLAVLLSALSVFALVAALAYIGVAAQLNWPVLERLARPAAAMAAALIALGLFICVRQTRRAVVR